MVKNYISVLKKYADFSGRAGQKEFWTFFLVNGALFLLLAFPSVMYEHTVLGNIAVGLFSIVLLGTIVPFYAVAARRLHDTGRSGWWILIKFIPGIGGLILLILLFQGAEQGSNKYGPSLVITPST